MAIGDQRVGHQGGNLCAGPEQGGQFHRQHHAGHGGRHGAGDRHQCGHRGGELCADGHRTRQWLGHDDFWERAGVHPHGGAGFGAGDQGGAEPQHGRTQAAVFEQPARRTSLAAAQRRFCRQSRCLRLRMALRPPAKRRRPQHLHLHVHLPFRQQLECRPESRRRPAHVHGIPRRHPGHAAPECHDQERRLLRRSRSPRAGRALRRRGGFHDGRAGQHPLQCGPQ